MGPVRVGRCMTVCRAHREFGGFREEVGYQGQQGEAGSSRGFAGGSWPSTLTDPSSQQSAEYPLAAERR